MVYMTPAIWLDGAFAGQLFLLNVIGKLYISYWKSIRWLLEPTRTAFEPPSNDLRTTF